MTVDQIVESGMRAFWETVQKANPHMLALGGGSVDVESDIRLRATAKEAVTDFIEKNNRDTWTEVGTVVILEFGSNLCFTKRKLLGFVWASDHETFRTHAQIRLDDWQSRDYKSKVSTPVDAGVVKLLFDKDGTNEWYYAKGSQRFPVKVTAPHNAWHMSASPKFREGFVEIREIIDVVEIPLMRFPMPRDMSSAERGSIMMSAGRLVAEINMARFAKTNWEGLA